MYKIFNFLMSASLIFISTGFDSINADVLASFDGGKVEESETLQAGAIPFYEIQLQEERLKQQVMLNLLKDKLVAIEENTSGKKWKQLIVEFIDKTYNAELSKNLKTYFNNTATKSGDFSEQGGEPGNESEDEGRQTRYEVENKYFLSLVKKYNVKFNFKNPQPPVIAIDTTNQPWWGKSDAKVTIVEFSDFECPYCKRMQNDILKIKAKYSDKIKWVFIDFPLEFHKNAMLAHIGAHCGAEEGAAEDGTAEKGAGKQKDANNKYFELQQLLFQSSPTLDKKTIVDLAQSLRLDSKNFQTCINDKDDKKKKQIEGNARYGKKLGISGTPTLFINGKYHPGLLEYKELEEIIEREL
jgi:protein-disulfide isomerase